MKIILVTGAAGFIGFHVSKDLLKRNFKVIGLDNMNNYYSVKLKKKRLNLLKKFKKFKFFKIDIKNNFKLLQNLQKEKIHCIIHLAAQAGVRHSILKPRDYLNSNVIGYYNILELAKSKKIKHLLLASTSSIYGNSKKKIFNERDKTDFPVQFYAATKKSCEVMSHAFTTIYKLPTTVLRFFTVYGPYGRPDMAYYKFAENITNNKQISVFNYGKQTRDFTYIDDITNAITKIVKKPPTKKINYYRILNIGKGKSDKLSDFIKYLELYLGKKAKKKLIDHQLGDVKYTRASVKKLQKLIGFKPKVSLRNGLQKFTDWYLRKN